MSSFALSTSRGDHALAQIAAWIVKRGILAVILLVPAAALLIGFLLHLIPLPAATFAVFIAVGLFTAWVSYRGTHSDDPDEPVHHLHRYALYALLPVAAFTLVQIPAFFAADVMYWQLWYELGSAFIREPSTHRWSLPAGIVLYALVGLSLVMCSYVLPRRPSLLSAVVFLGVIVPALFVTLFSTFSVAGAHLGPAWYVTFWTASIVGAFTAWLVPMAWPRVRSGLHGRALVAVLAGVALLVTAPFAFAVVGATGWQSGEQQRIDHAAFERIAVEPDGPLVLAGVSDQTARYDFTLRFGPRTYTDAAGVVRAVDAGPVTVEGRLSAAGETVAWCTGYVGKLDSPNTLRDPAAFQASTERLNYVEVPVSCAGSTDAMTTLCVVDGVTVAWKADATLVGARSTEQRQFSGQTRTSLTFPAGSVCP